MTDETGDPVRKTAPREPGLVGRLVGVLFSPRKAYEAVVRKPRALGALLVVSLCMAGGTGWLLSTEVGKQAALEQQVDAMESFGVTVSTEIYTQMERRLDSALYFSIGGGLVSVPLITAVLSGVLWTVCYVLLGAHAPFKAMFAVVAHAGVINIVQQLFVVPLNYARGAMSSPSNLAVFFPMLEDGTFAQRALALVDLFIVWQLFVLAVGVAVLYGRRTGPIATTFYVIYTLVAAGGGFALSRIGG